MSVLSHLAEEERGEFLECNFGAWHAHESSGVPSTLEWGADAGVLHGAFGQRYLVVSLTDVSIDKELPDTCCRIGASRRSEGEGGRKRKGCLKEHVEKRYRSCL